MDDLCVQLAMFGGRGGGEERRCDRPWPRSRSCLPAANGAGEHANKTCRRLHLVGTTLSTGTAVTALATGNYNLLWAVPLIGYGSAWVGHFFFEHNRPATFKHPLYSLAGDYRMWWEVLSGQRAF